MPKPESSAEYLQRRPFLIRAARSMFQAGFTKAEIRASLGGLKKSTVDGWIIGLSPDSMVGHTSEDEMRAWAESGGSWTGLAEKIGRSVHSVTTTASILGIKSGRSISSRTTVPNILKMRERGMSQQQIADKLGISKHTVCYHCNRNNVGRGPRKS